MAARDVLSEPNGRRFVKSPTAPTNNLLAPGPRLKVPTAVFVKISARGLWIDFGSIGLTSWNYS